jgi:hypothetical protein
MRRSILCLALALLVGPAHLPGLQYCPAKLNTGIREYSDFRIRSIFLNILYKTNMDPKKFALCEDLFALVPHTVDLATTPGQSVVAVLLTHQARNYTSSELRGLIAHELGHEQLRGKPKNIELEIAVDKIAAGWVGSQAVIAGLRALLPEFERFSGIREIYQAQIMLRIDLLAYPRRTAQRP